MAIASTGAQGRPSITALSTDASLVTGGDVLVKVAFGSGVTADSLKVSVAGRDVSNVFQPAAEPGSFIGLVTGLANGKNIIDAGTKSGTRATLEVVNYPITGPVISGPWQQPFICQTNEFTLPDGSKLGPPLDGNCSARTIVQHVYRSTSDPKTLKPLPEGGTLPADVAKTTTSEGRTVRRAIRRPPRPRRRKAGTGGSSRSTGRAARRAGISRAGASASTSWTTRSWRTATRFSSTR